jgi:hypothetical protein
LVQKLGNFCIFQCKIQLLRLSFANNSPNSQYHQKIKFFWKKKLCLAGVLIGRNNESHLFFHRNKLRKGCLNVHQLRDWGRESQRWERERETHTHTEGGRRDKRDNPNRKGWVITHYWRVWLSRDNLRNPDSEIIM